MLLNHINDIQNVNENVLVWNDEDVIDNDENARFHENVENEVIVDSIKNSPFSEYLKVQIKSIEKLNPAAVSGVIMKSYNQSTCVIKENIIEMLNDSFLKPPKRFIIDFLPTYIWYVFSTSLLESSNFIIDQENNTECKNLFFKIILFQVF